MNAVAVFNRLGVAQVHAGERGVLKDQVVELVLTLAAIDVVVLQS